MTDKQLILAVDDEAGNLQLLHQILGDDYRLLLAKDGERALALARDKQPALILLDVVMPGLDGYEICRRLKADAATAAIPVIFVTSSDSSDDEQRGLACGAADYISKPASPPIVQARVRTHLALARAQQRLAGQLQFDPQLLDAFLRQLPETELCKLRRQDGH